MNSKTGGPAFPSGRRFEIGDGWQTECGMTMREYAAIKLKVPDSGTVWLDEMIAQSLRDEVAAKAMQALMSRPEHAHFAGSAHYAQASYVMADAMLRAREAA